MHQETETARARLRAMTPTERARLARDTEQEMRFPYRHEAVAGGDQGSDELGGFLVSGPDGDHLPTERNGQIDHALLGAAWAALHEGYRGNRYAGPDKEEALAKLTAIYHQEGLPLPSRSSTHPVER